MTVIVEQIDELQAAQQEIRNLKITIQALREKIETVNFDKDNTVSAAISESNEQIQQLRATVIAMHDEMELLKFNFEDKMEKLTSNTRDESRQMQETIRKLRGRLDFQTNQKKQNHEIKS